MPPTGVTSTKDMYGGHDGKMLTLSLSPFEGKEEGPSTPDSIDVSAKVANDTIYFESFPIRDLVLSIVGDEETADQIVEAVGDVDYRIGYTPGLNATRDSILFTLDPKPLKLSVNLPSGTDDGEPAQPLAIEVKVTPAPGAGYAARSTNMTFKFQAEEVLLGEGEGQAPLPGFTPTTFDFKMQKADKR